MRYATALVAVLSLGSFVVADEPITDPAKLEGTYKIVGGQNDSVPYSKEAIAGWVVTIKGDTMTITDKNQKVFLSCTFTIDTTGTTSPQYVAMTTIAPMKGLELAGIIDREGETIRICYSQPEHDTPADFAAKKDQNSFVLKPVR